MVIDVTYDDDDNDGSDIRINFFLLEKINGNYWIEKKIQHLIQFENIEKIIKFFFPINQMIETSYSNDISVVCLSVLVQNVRRGMKKQGQTVIWFFDLIRD